jgi:hypothetical protein
VATEIDPTKLSLASVIKLVALGRVTPEEWRAYAHLWQTSAARIAVRACQCPACVRDYPEPDYSPTFARTAGGTALTWPPTA